MSAWVNHLPDAPSIIASFWSELAILAFLFFLRVFGIDIFRKIKSLWRWIFALSVRFSGRRLIFLYTDCDDGQVTNHGLREHLESGFASVRVVSLENAEQLLEWPVHPFLVHSCLVFVTDVTPLSASEQKRRTIQGKLEYYVHSGGVLVLGHDALYRRSRNPVLQKLAGCQLSEFHRPDACVRYKLFLEKESPRYEGFMTDNLPDGFELDDREYVTGDWASDVKWIYVLESETGKQIPLVTYRTCGKGSILWFNSGDSTCDGPPESLGTPNERFVEVLLSLVTRAQNRSASRCRKRVSEPIPS